MMGHVWDRVTSSSVTGRVGEVLAERWTPGGKTLTKHTWERLRVTAPPVPPAPNPHAQPCRHPGVAPTRALWLQLSFTTLGSMHMY